MGGKTLPKQKKLTKNLSQKLKKTLDNPFCVVYNITVI